MTQAEGVFLGLAILLAIFFIGREITLWYFKINKRVDNQEELIRISKSIEEQLRQINKHNGSN